MNKCENCKEAIKVKYGSGRFCSIGCARGFATKTNRAEISRKVSDSLKGRKIVDVERNCEQCKKTFVSLLRKRRRFCSKKCAAHSRGNGLVGYDKYKRECQFNFALSDYPEEFDFSLITKHGWYSAKNRGNNLNGVSRDHIVSIRWGFENGVDSKYIKHPANCQLLLQRKNVSKGKKKSISVEELIKRTEIWDMKYLGSKH